MTVSALFSKHESVYKPNASLLLLLLQLLALVLLLLVLIR